MRRLRLLIVLFVACAVGPISAIYILYVAWTEPHPTVMDCIDFLATRGVDAPTWLDLRDCTLDYRHAVTLSDRARGKQDSDPYYVAVVIRMGDPDIALLYKVSPAEAANMRRLAKVSPDVREAELSRLSYHRRIVGVTENGMMVGSNYRDALTRGAEANGQTYVRGWKTIQDGAPIPAWVALFCLLPLFGVIAYFASRRLRR
jgi:hypothetical protein